MSIFRSITATESKSTATTEKSPCFSSAVFRPVRSPCSMNGAYRPFS